MHTSGVSRVYETLDRKYLQVMCPFPKYQESLREIVGSQGFASLLEKRYDTQERAEHMDEYWQMLDRAFRTKPRAEWIAILETADIPCAPVNSVGEALELPQLAHRNAIVEVDVAEAGRVKTMAPPFGFDAPLASAMSSPPFLGQHTDEVLQEVLGLSARYMAALTQSGAFGAAQAPRMETPKGGLDGLKDPAGPPANPVESAARFHRQRRF